MDWANALCGISELIVVACGLKPVSLPCQAKAEGVRKLNRFCSVRVSVFVLHGQRVVSARSVCSQCTASAQVVYGQCTVTVQPVQGQYMIHAQCTATVHLVHEACVVAELGKRRGQCVSVGTAVQSAYSQVYRPVYSQCTASAQPVHSRCTAGARSAHAQCTVSAQPVHSQVYSQCRASAQPLHSQCTASAQSKVQSVHGQCMVHSAQCTVHGHCTACVPEACAVAVLGER